MSITDTQNLAKIAEHLETLANPTKWKGFDADAPQTVVEGLAEIAKACNRIAEAITLLAGVIRDRDFR